MSGTDLSWLWQYGPAFTLGGVAIALLQLLRQASSLHRLRLHAEQGLAGQRAEADTTRAQLIATERALASRQEQARLEAQDAAGRMAVLLEAKLREMAETSAARLAAIERTVGAQLHAAVEQQMATSFGRVLDGFAAVQKGDGRGGNGSVPASAT